MPQPIRLAYLVSHPIQYQAPLLRRIAQEPDVDLTVFFGSNFSVRGYKDEGFGVGVQWDVPLLEGYRHDFLPVLRDPGTVSATSPLNHGILRRLAGTGEVPAFDALWVHGYASANAMHGILAARALGIPVLLRAESWWNDRPRSPRKLAAKRMFFRGLREMIDAVLPIGTRNSEYWTRYFGNAVPQFPMPYAVDNGFFERNSAAAAVRRPELLRQLHLEPGRAVILFASKLQPRKRCADLIEAYRLLVANQERSSVPYLAIVGDGEQRAALEQQAAGLDGVRFCGFQNQTEMPRYFDLATVFVLPSEHEPWGLVVNEAMNAGCAVIVSEEVGCQPDLVTDGVEGCVFRAGDTLGLADTLLRVLHSREAAAEMGRRARERVRRWDFEQDVRGLRQALAWAVRRPMPETDVAERARYPLSRNGA